MEKIKIYAQNVEKIALETIKELETAKWAEDSIIRIMPDVHQGKGCVIGTTMTIKNKIVPNIVGVDIGCGMLCVELGKIDIDLKELDQYINLNIKTGFNINEKPLANFNYSKIRCFDELEKTTEEFDRAIGTLGGGNHFIEIDESTNGTKFLVIHSGSRNLGNRVAMHYQNLAYNKLLQKHKKLLEEITAKLKAENRHSEIQNALKEIGKFNVHKESAWLEDQDFKNYINDMKIIQEYASENRREITKKLLAFIKPKLIGEEFETIHNYIDVDNMIVRKGAISAQKGEKLLIPINMRDGCIIGVGKGNEDWNYSAPHGAGRIMSRNEAKKNISIDKFKESMSNIYSSSVVESTIDESPFAYKDLDYILENIKDTVAVLEVIKPIYNFKDKGENTK